VTHSLLPALPDRLATQPLAHTPLEHLRHRIPDAWLIGYDCQKLWELAEQLHQELLDARLQFSPTAPFRILLAEPDPLQFLAKFIAATSLDCHLFLCNPAWGDREWQQVLDLTQPHLSWITSAISRQPSAVSSLPSAVSGTAFRDAQHTLTLAPSALRPLPSALILISTGGSSGKVRFAMHTWETLTASVVGFRQYFAVDRVNSLCVLPLHHVSGLMQVVRSLVSGGKLAIVPFKNLEAGHWPSIHRTDFFLSLVPTQLHRLLQAPESSSTRLAQLQTVLLGGAPAWPDLLNQARQLNIPLAPTYGMTETASQIATLKSTDFLAGETGCGQILPHATVTICDRQSTELPPNQIGTVQIRGRSLFLGYYPALSKVDTFQPDDLGFLDDNGSLHLIGRQSDKIITGGENLFPAEVEAAIRATGFVEDVCIVGVDDPTWGQSVAAVYVSTQTASPIAETLKAALRKTLSAYKHPKHWIAVAALPRNAQGKVNREQVKAIVCQFLQNSAL
jgi:o-succinylbenzoate---CoA ligase